jgi:hypothetical protein
MDVHMIDEVSEQSLVGQAIRDLVRLQLGNEQTLDATLRQIGFGSGGTLLLGGFVDGQLATMNAFMPQTFLRNGAKVVGFQSGFSATGGEHRGKGYWPKLLNASMDILTSRGADFIFGFPNPVSQPLFEKKLGFDTAQMWRTVLPTTATYLKRFRCSPGAGTFVPDLEQLTRRKAQVHPDLVQIDTGTWSGFGKVRKSRGLHVIDIGGMQSTDGELNLPIRRLGRKAGAAMFRFEASESSCFSASFRPKRFSRPVIFKRLASDLRIDDITFLGGLSDDF